MNKLIDFFKKEIVFSISIILAVISCFFVHPSFNYFAYINWQTIVLLFSIMLVVEILKNATNRSLIILDEVGRGTSTFDGISIAKSINI